MSNILDLTSSRVLEVAFVTKSRHPVLTMRLPGRCERGMAARLRDVDDESLARLAAVTEAAGGSSAALTAAVARAGDAPDSCAVVLVEGTSDQAALETLAARGGRDLHGEGVFIVPMGGATNIGHFLGRFGPRGFGVRLACATRARSAISGAVWSRPGSAPGWTGPGWPDSVSSFA